MQRVGSPVALRPLLRRRFTRLLLRWALSLEAEEEVVELEELVEEAMELDGTGEMVGTCWNMLELW